MEQKLNKQNWRTLFFITTIILVPAFLALLALNLVATNGLIYSALHSLVNPEDSFSLNYSGKVIQFLKGNLDISEDPNFTLAEYNHLEDVKSIFDNARLWMYASLMLLILSLILSNKKIPGLWYGANLSLLIVLILFVLSFIYGFNVFFDNFHKPFFNTGSWKFPQDSRLIKTYPIEFFMYFGIAYAGAFVLLSLILLLVTTMIRRKK